MYSAPTVFRPMGVTRLCVFTPFPTWRQTGMVWTFRCRIFSARDYLGWKEPSPARLARSRGRRLILPSLEVGRAPVGPRGEGFRSGGTALWGTVISVPNSQIL